MKRPSRRRSLTPGSLSLLCWVPGIAQSLAKLPTPQVSHWAAGSPRGLFLSLYNLRSSFFWSQALSGARRLL